MKFLSIIKNLFKNKIKINKYIKGNNLVSLKDIEDDIKFGDVVLFTGEGFIPKLIMVKTDSVVSHAGIIIKTGKENEIETMESTFDGVAYWDLKYQVERDHNLRIYVLPLSDKIRNKLDVKKAFTFAEKQLGKPYSINDAFLSSLNWFDDIRELFNKNEDYDSFFCSKLVIAILKESGVLEDHIIPENLTPSELASLKIYKDFYFQIKGEQKEIEEFNSINQKDFKLVKSI